MLGPSVFYYYHVFILFFICVTVNRCSNYLTGYVQHTAWFILYMYCDYCFQIVRKRIMSMTLLQHRQEGEKVVTQMTMLM